MNLDKLTYKTIVLQIKAITLQLKYFNIKLLLIKEIIKIFYNELINILQHNNIEQLIKTNFNNNSMKHFKNLLPAVALMATMGMSPMSSFAADINVIPTPVKLTQQKGEFSLPSNVSMAYNTDEGKAIAQYLANKLKTSTGCEVSMGVKKGTVNIVINPSMKMNDEGYRLQVTPKGVTIKAKTGKGAFYGMQTFLQLLPAEVESESVAKGVKWVAQCCDIDDYPRFGYRGFHLDPCRHFITAENVKKQIDLMASLKVNTMHFHLTEDQGWRIEIKKYPKLTSIGSWRKEGDGKVYGGFYTQEQIKDIVAYAAKRYVTVIPEVDLPGHMMAAIAAYPELSCKGEQWTLRTVWGVEDIVMCPGKELMFNFLDDIFKEMVPLFPGIYFHIGGDECPKTSWKNCPTCQKRIADEHLQGDGKHTSEERLQSYVIKRVEKMLDKYGKKIIGWDEILEGGLSENATVMSWRGIDGGIEAAKQGHDVIMTPGSGGLYLDHYQGDPRIEPLTIPSNPAYLSKTYAFDPVPEVIREAGLEKHVLGVQCNNWSEYMYSNAKMEYMMYPRSLALSEVAWSPLNRKDFANFSKRVDANLVRLDKRHINYHMPLPEQPLGSCDKVVIVKDTTVTFTTSRPMKMVYTLDGTTPTPQSTVYTEPIKVSNNCVLNIATVLPSGKMSKIRTIQVEKQTYAPAVEVKDVKPGLAMKRIRGHFNNVLELQWTDDAWETSIINNFDGMKIKQADDGHTLRGENGYAAIAEGYINVPEDGVYYVSSRTDQVWIDSKLVIDNSNEVKSISHHDSCVALAKGLHPVKFIFVANITGGWPAWWNELNIQLRKDNTEKFVKIADNQLFH